METWLLQHCVCPLLLWEPLRHPTNLCQCRACHDCTVTSGSVKPHFDCCCFHSKVSPYCFEFLCFLYTFFPSRLLCLMWLMVFLFSINSFGKAPFQRFLCIPSAHTIYTHAPILTADVIWPFCRRWTPQTHPHMQMKSQDVKYRV